MFALLEFVFPYSHDMPTFLFQRAIHFPVAPLISQQLRKPVVGIASGPSSVLWTEMPETAINKYDHSMLWEDEIRFPRQRSMATPASNIVGPQNLNQREFSVFISATPNLRHAVGALLFCEHVRHV